MHNLTHRTFNCPLHVLLSYDVKEYYSIQTALHSIWQDSAIDLQYVLYVTKSAFTKLGLVEHDVLLGHYAVNSFNSLPTFWDLSVPSCTCEDGTYRLSRNVVKKLSLLTA
jgi:hypothetical protein